MRFPCGWQDISARDSVKTFRKRGFWCRFTGSHDNPEVRGLFLKVTFVQASNRFFADTQMFGVHFMPVWAYTLAAHLSNLPDLDIRLFDDRFDDPAAIECANVFLFTGIN